MGRALERHEQQTARVIPIIVRPCDWEGLPFANLQCLPPGGIPVSEAPDHDKPWTAVAKGIRRTYEELRERSGTRAPITPPIHPSGDYGLTSYLQHLVVSYQKLSWLPRALTLTVTDARGYRHPANDALYDWSKSREAVLLLSGGPGSGKTSTLQALAARLAQERLSDVTDVTPLYVLARSLGAPSFEDLRAAIPEARAVIDHVLSANQPAIVLLDGVDELLVNVASAALGSFVRDFIRAFPSSARFLISCRTSVAEAITEALAASHPVVYHLAALSDEEVRRYVRNGSLIDGVVDLRSREPLILRLLDETGIRNHRGIHELFAEVIANIVQGTLEREHRLTGRSEAEVIEFLTDLAVRMFPRIDISLSAFEDRADESVTDLAGALVTAGLLALDTREHIAFVHASFFEYFFARALMRSFVRWDARLLASVNLIHAYGINRFLVPLTQERVVSTRSQRAQDVAAVLHRKSIRLAGHTITRPVLRSDFVAFVDDTGWRKNVGWGRWRTFIAPDGTHGSSDHSIPDPSAWDLAEWSDTDDVPASDVSWYDAAQFAAWVGGRLAAAGEIRDVPYAITPALEWTGEWFAEGESLLRVASAHATTALGFNPDFRSPQLGFRVVLPDPQL